MAADLCRTTCQKIWSGFYLVTWLILLLGSLLWILATAKLVPSVADLPNNLSNGFDIIFGFDSMSADGKKVQDASTAALTKCGEVAANCPILVATNPARVVDTKADKDIIVAAQGNSLTKLDKVCSDKYLGVDSFATASTNLNTVSKETAKIQENETCAIQVPTYCALYASGEGIVTGMKTVNDQLKKFKDSDIVKNWKDAADLFSLMYAFPAILIISALFFCCTWFKDGACCCSASKCGCCLSCCHCFFWLLFFILISIIMVGSILVMSQTDSVKVPVVKGKPSVKVFMDHLEKEFPAFYNKVFKDMIEGLLGMYKASVVMWVFCIVIVSYGCCICCCKPYKKKKDTAKVADVEAAEKDKLQSTLQ